MNLARYLILALACSLPLNLNANAEKLYWFIPDGMRADPEVFDVFRWAREGKLPNIKKMMEQGSYGYAIPEFPSHTPTNFASLLTGAYPKIHGVADGPMHTEGFPLNRVSVGGFSSTAKKVPPLWVPLEKSGKKVVLLSIPGSTPPELDEGITYRGRWGGWGADFHPIIFQSKGDLVLRRQQGRGTKVFFFGPELTQYVESSQASGWPKSLAIRSDAWEAAATGWGLTVYLNIHSSESGAYDRIAFSLDKKTILAVLEAGEWSDWHKVSLTWKDVEVPSHVKFHVIRVEPSGAFRVRFLYDNMNEFIAKPGDAAVELVDAAGPMVDFVDNFPAQLIYYPEDKKTFIEEQNLAMEWHQRAGAFILDRYRPDVFIQDTYCPNQMLTSRWWMGSLDPVSARYGQVSDAERTRLWEEVLKMYRQLDDIIGNMLKAADGKTLVVLSSDHGAVPLNRSIRLNNLFAKEGWLKFTIDPQTGEPSIDWGGSTVIFLKMDGVFINPNGLAGNWKRGSGTAYNKLRRKVKERLKKVKDEGGQPILTRIVEWEKVVKELNLPTDRVGDLVVANAAGYGFDEEMTEDHRLFDSPLIAGYKQAIIAEKVKGMWTPFVVMGPGVKKNFEIKKPIRLIDQYPTLMMLLDQPLPDHVEGRVLKEVLERGR